MAVIFPRAGLLISLRCLLNQQVPEDLDLRLYTNAITPEEGDTRERYLEARGYGYEPIRLQGAQWQFKGNPIEGRYPRQTFRFNGPAGDIYGCFATQAESGELVLAEFFADGPYRVGAAGGMLGLSLVIGVSGKG